ncbi:MAG: aspartate kinase, partial [Gemmatimonadaceae bacterium]
MIVCKFGGTSVGDAAAITRVVDIVTAKLDQQPVVVVSALGGATNQLLDLAHKAADGELRAALDIIAQLRDRHLHEAQALLAGTSDAEALALEIGSAFEELAHLAEAFRTLGYLTPRSLDAVAAVGELLSSQIVAAAFRQRGLPGVYVDARDVVRTNDLFTRAEPDTEAIARACREHIVPLLQQRRIPVLGGFVGSTAGRVTTTLGRGGSDYSASLIGAAIDAAGIEIWTDVDGMLTADPRRVPKAFPMPEVTFEEAMELCHFGAKVIYPPTIQPAIEAHIPLVIKNTKNPQALGTRIVETATRHPYPITGISSISSIALARIQGTGMVCVAGIAMRFFSALAKHNINVILITQASSEHTIC